jgi:hypothetical protein
MNILHGDFAEGRFRHPAMSSLRLDARPSKVALGVRPRMWCWGQGPYRATVARGGADRHETIVMLDAAGSAHDSAPRHHCWRGCRATSPCARPPHLFDATTR